ncbi:MAG: SGNH/GDSL hydrolase family protein, partial [Actinomycetes bacterium]
VLPWLLQRLLFVDPLSSRRSATTRWVSRTRSPDLAPGHPWMVDPAERPDRPFRRWRVALAFAVAIPALIFTLTVLGSRSRPLVGGNPAAFTGAQWWPQHAEDLRTITVAGVAWNPYTAQHVQDVELATIKVRNGHRVTWAPPPSTGRVLTVWVYGGSTTFGFGQRDAHTMPSELARIATDAGYRVNVVNKGVPGDLHADEARRFAWDVSDADPTPDVVVFYDGVNDVAAANERNEHRTNGDSDTPSLVLGDLRNDFRNHRELSDRLFPPTRPSGAGISPTTTSPLLGPIPLAQRAVRDYERARLSSRSVAAATGVQVLWFWQPTRFSRPPVPGEPTTPDDAFLTTEYDTAKSLIADDVIDLTGVFTANRDPIFYDTIHTNEAGARIVAAGIFEHLRPALDRANAPEAPR